MSENNIAVFNLEGIVFIDDSIILDDDSLSAEDVTAEMVAREAWSQVVSWVQEGGYLPSVSIKMPNGFEVEIDLEDVFKDS